MININYGVLSSLILIILNILIITDWFKVEVLRLGGKKLVCCCLLIIFFLSYIVIPIDTKFSINLGAFFLLLIAFIIFIKEGGLIGKLYTFFAAVISGIIFFLLKEIFMNEPVLLIYDELFLIVIFMSIYTLLVDLRSKKYIPIIFAGVLLGEFIFKFYHQDEFVNVILGDAFTRDIIWLSILLVMLINGIVDKFKVFLQGLNRTKKIR